MAPPSKPKIYHITHVDNLQSIIKDGCLISDAMMIERGGPDTAIGMSEIKERRLFLPVDCHPGDFVGEYVPFYFCFRSIMLYVIHRANHADLNYRGGQGPIVHLEANLFDVVDWADSQKRRWAFSLSNAGAAYTQFRSSLDDLDKVDWTAVRATDWRAPEIKEGKQAEFLMHRTFPWDLVSRIGVRTIAIKTEVDRALRGADHCPKVIINSSWYY